MAVINKSSTHKSDISHKNNSTNNNTKGFLTCADVIVDRDDFVLTCEAKLSGER
jgi:hypothetical protein